MFLRAAAQKKSETMENCSFWLWLWAQGKMFEEDYNSAHLLAFLLLIPHNSSLIFSSFLTPPHFSTPHSSHLLTSLLLNSSNLLTSLLLNSSNLISLHLILQFFRLSAVRWRARGQDKEAEGNWVDDSMLTSQMYAMKITAHWVLPSRWQPETKQNSGQQQIVRTLYELLFTLQLYLLVIYNY